MILMEETRLQKYIFFSLETLQWVKQVGRIGLAVVVLVLWDG